MSVPPFVPPDVPADGGPARRARTRKTSNRNAGTASYVSRTDAGWRFQMRLPGRLAHAESSSTIRAALGPRSRPEARRLGRQLAALCTAICDEADVRQQETDMKPLDEKETALVQQVVNACQQAIKTAINQPTKAIGLAKGLDAALTSLRLVQTEIGKGEAGARAVIDNADAISRAALKDVLKHASNPDAAREVLDMTSDIPRSLTADAALPRPAGATVQSQPTFGAISQRYIDMRTRNGAKPSEIQRLRFSRQSFIDLIGDRPIDQYFPSDLQEYVTLMQHYPANASKVAELKGLSLREILKANKTFRYKPIARKTLQDGFVAGIRTGARASMADLHYRDPFSGVELRWPEILQASVPREGIGFDVLNRVFRAGTASGNLDEAILPLLSYLSSRRLGLLAYMCGADIREKYGVAIAQVTGLVQINGHWQSRPIKTDESGGFFVLHDFLTETGFTDWARRQDGWIFASLHEHPDPAKYASKIMNRLLQRNGATGAGEVFHSLRGEAIDAMREADMKDRTKRLQAGHDLGDVHERYGTRALSAEECRRLATLPLAMEIDWSVFRNLDLDALAAKRRGRGRPPNGGR